MKLFKKIGIDIGSSNTLFWVEGEGIVLNEPTLVAVGLEDRRVLAVGKEAKSMLGKTPEYIEVVRPLLDGVISDYDVTEAMLRIFLKQVMGKSFFIGPEAMLSVPAGVTQVEQRAVMDAIMSAGARKAYLIDEPLAAAIGAKIPVADCFGNMIVNLGGGVTEAAVIALGGVVTHNSNRVGGINFDMAISEYLRKEKSLIVGEYTSEQLKIKLGSAIKLKRPEVIQINGRDAYMGLPKDLSVSSDEIYEAIKPQLELMIEVIKGVLEMTPPELIADIFDRGMILCGGMANLRNIATFITREVGVSTHVAIEPQTCVIKGTGMAIENLETYKRAFR